MKKVLTVAGSDPSGGAGIQADLKTMEAHGVYGMSVITALTAQNTMGITGKQSVSGDFVREQLKAVFEDIFPDAVKIGMLPDVDVMKALREIIKTYHPQNIVLDPVLSSTSGTELSRNEAREYLKKEIFPLCDIITPNIPETEILSGIKISGKDDMERAAKYLGEEYCCNVIVKGGHADFYEGKSKDCLYNGSFIWYESEHLDNLNTHGTGCTLSSAIACNLADGYGIEEAVKRAKTYITNCIGAGLDIGKGRGPLEHRVQTSEIKKK